MPVLILSPNGQYTHKASLADALSSADVVGKTVVVTSPQTVTTALTVPSDVELKFENGGYVTFSGGGALIGLKESRPEWFGSITYSVDGAGGSDTTIAINKAIASVTPLGGTVIFSVAQYLTTSTIVVPSGVTLVGSGYYNGTSVAQQSMTSIYGEHSGAAVVSLKGANGNALRMIGIEGSSVTPPKTGLLLGRPNIVSPPSCGWHNFSQVAVSGYFTEAAVYSIASEENTWTDVRVILMGGGAVDAFVTSTKDISAVDDLAESSNLANTLTKLCVQNWVNDAGASCLLMDCGQAMGSWTFIGCYLIPMNGAYVTIKVGAVDGLAPLGPFTFVGVSGERYGDSGDPVVGYDLISTGSITIPGLTIIGTRFAFLTPGPATYLIRQSANLALSNPHIAMQLPNIFPYPLIDLNYDYILNGYVDIGDSSNYGAVRAWTPVVTSTAGTLTTVSATGTYTKIGKNINITYDILITTNGTGSGGIKCAGLPFEILSRSVGIGYEGASTGFTVTSTAIENTTYFNIFKPDFTYPGGTGYRLTGNFTYIAK